MQLELSPSLLVKVQPWRLGLRESYPEDPGSKNCSGTLVLAQQATYSPLILADAGLARSLVTWWTTSIRVLPRPHPSLPPSTQPCSRSQRGRTLHALCTRHLLAGTPSQLSLHTPCPTATPSPLWPSGSVSGWRMGLTGRFLVPPISDVPLPGTMLSSQAKGQLVAKEGCASIC